MMRNTCITLLLFIFSSVLKAQEKIPLYPATEIPFKTVNAEMPTLTVFRPENQGNGTAIIICSGGSYARRANEEEGLPAAKMFAQAGITAFLLDYRLPHGLTSVHDSIPFSDTQAAIRYIRENANNYHIRKSKIGIIGFSAGGHLVSTVITHSSEDFGNSHSITSARPDFAVLVYPVISMQDNLTHVISRWNLLGKVPSEDQKNKFSNELQVKSDTPPVFIVHALDDRDVKVDNSLLFAAALRQQRIPVEMFLYAKGGHGFGIDNRTAQVQWTEPAIEWIKQITKK